jgi:hypothetical protein
VIDQPPRMAGLSGDLGWNESDEQPMGRLSTALLVAATSAYWGSLWVLAGLPPLSSVMSRRRRAAHE